MERLKSENDALIFVNKELGRINEELRDELDQAKSNSRRQSQSNFSEDEISDEENSRPRKRIKGKSKVVNKSTEAQETDDDAARVCKIFYYVLMFLI